MPTHSISTNAENVALDQKNIAGVTKYFTALPTILLAGTETTAPKINGIFQADIDATNALDAAEADVKQKRAAQKAARKAAQTQRGQLKTYILGNYGSQAVQMLEDCGFEAPKPPGPKTVASKAQAVAASKATRAAGGAKAVKAKAAAAASAPAAAAGQPPAPTGGGATPAK
ncbi:MAG TPA: hypothetical protein VGG39_08430 [Polyangiaceae bacterium]|jgi:hypothetical protein